MYFKYFRKYFVYFGYLTRISGLFLYKLCCFTLRQYLRKTNDSSLAHILMKKLCCGFNLKRTMADWESLTGANPHNDFLSLYMSRTQSTPIYPHMNGHQPELAFAPSPKKESAESFASILDRDFDNFCNSENIDEAVTYLNQEFTALGFPSLYDKGNKVHDPVRLINATYELLQRTQRSLRVREELENRCHRYESDVDHLQNGQDRLKASIDSHVRELVQIQEKERQLKNKNKLLDKKLKTEKEEVKRLQSVIQHRDAQYKHELKKKERELIKLKDRMHSLIVDKSDRRLGLEMKMVNNLQRMDKARSRWAANSAKEEEELYRGIISTYEQKQQELMVENVGLRDSLNHLQEELIAMLKSNNNSQLDIFNGSKEDGENSDHEASDNEEDSDLVSAQRPEAKLASGVFQMPYDLVRPTIEQTLKDKCHKLKRYIKKVEKQRKKDEASSVCSSGLCGNGPQAASVTMSPSSAAAHQEEVERLNKQIERYRQIIEEQETMLQNQLDDQAEGESHATALLNETALWEEKDHLERDRHLFMEKQQNFELERANFTEAAIRLARERQAFEEEKASLLTQQFKNLTPFTNKTTSHTRPASASVTTKTPKRNDEEQAFEEEKASLLTQQFKNLTPITNKTTSHTRPASASVTTKTPKRRMLPSTPTTQPSPWHKTSPKERPHTAHGSTSGKKSADLETNVRRTINAVKQKKSDVEKNKTPSVGKGSKQHTEEKRKKSVKATRILHHNDQELQQSSNKKSFNLSHSTKNCQSIVKNSSNISNVTESCLNNEKHSDETSPKEKSLYSDQVTERIQSNEGQQFNESPKEISSFNSISSKECSNSPGNAINQEMAEKLQNETAITTNSCSFESMDVDKKAEQISPATSMDVDKKVEQIYTATSIDVDKKVEQISPATNKGNRSLHCPDDPLPGATEDNLTTDRTVSKTIKYFNKQSSPTCAEKLQSPGNDTKLHRDDQKFMESIDEASIFKRKLHYDDQPLPKPKELTKKESYIIMKHSTGQSNKGNHNNVDEDMLSQTTIISSSFQDMGEEVKVIIDSDYGVIDSIPSDIQSEVAFQSRIDKTIDSAATKFQHTKKTKMTNDFKVIESNMSNTLCDKNTQRNLPETPNKHESKVHTIPTTEELYRTLGLVPPNLKQENGSPPDGGAGADRQSGQVRPRPHTAHGCSPAPGSRRHASKPVVTLSPPEASRVAQHIDGVKLTLSYQEKDRGGANF